MRCVYTQKMRQLNAGMLNLNKLNTYLNTHARAHACRQTHAGEWVYTYKRYTLQYTSFGKCVYTSVYGVAMISKLLKLIGLFCKRALWKRLYSTKETYNLIDPTNWSHPISLIHIHTFSCMCLYTCLYTCMCLQYISQTCVYMYIYTRVYSCVCLYIYIYIHVSVYICMHTPHPRSCTQKFEVVYIYSYM